MGGPGGMTERHGRQSSDAELHRSLLSQGKLINHYQPIVGLCSGEVFGVEVLGRLQDGGQLIPPGAFLGHFGLAELDTLLFQSLRMGFETLRSCSARYPELTMAFNVSPALLGSTGFSRRMISTLREAEVDPHRITLEILEGDEFTCPTAAFGEVGALREAGVSIALDDVGTAYSSLMRLRDLPVDVLKLDQAFVRFLLEKPDDLQFVNSMVVLARGLRKRLVVEGVEHADIVNALQVLGVDGAQGFAIARPMPAERLSLWLAGHRARRRDRRPNCLLGVYAAHLMIVDTCQGLMRQPLGLTWPATIHDPHACTIGMWFDEKGLHSTACGMAHKRFHEVITTYEQDPKGWDRVADHFRGTVQAAIGAEQKRLNDASRLPAVSRRLTCVQC